MKQLLHLMDSGQVKYNDPYFRFFAAVASAQFIVALLEDTTWKDAWSERPYYMAIMISMGIALLLIYLVYRISIWLDARYPWSGNLFRRFQLQCLLGVAVPMAFAISIYYWRMDTSVFQIPYLRVLLKVKVLLLVLLNVYYIGLFLFTAFKLRKAINITMSDADTLALEEPSTGGITKELDESEEENRMAIETDLPAVLETQRETVVPVAVPATLVQGKMRLVALNEEKKRLEVMAVPSQLPPGWGIEELWLVLTEDREAKVYHQDQRTLPWTFAIKDTYPLLPIADFFWINKSCIVRRDNIQWAYAASDKRYVILVLQVPKGRKVTVGRDYKKAFKKWYGLIIHNSPTPFSFCP